MIAETIIILQFILICGFIYNTLRINKITDITIQLIKLQGKHNAILKRIIKKVGDEQ